MHDELAMFSDEYEDSNHVQDVADMFEYANISTYDERIKPNAIKKTAAYL